MMVGDPKCPVGFIVIGKMGFPMASRIAAHGYPLHAYDISTEALDAIAGQTSARVSRSLAEIGRNCEVVILMLPDNEKTGFQDAARESPARLLDGRRGGARRQRGPHRDLSHAR